MGTEQQTEGGYFFPSMLLRYSNPIKLVENGNGNYIEIPLVYSTEVAQEDKP